MTAAMYDSLDALQADLTALGRQSAEWVDKMVHHIPDAPCVPREPWLLKRLAGKVVLHVGCAGPFDAALCKVAQRCYGIDTTPMQRVDFTQMDVDTSLLPVFDDVEAVLLAEVLEHLTMPGFVLRQVREVYAGCEVVITVPNSFCPQPRLQHGVELVNVDHTHWYSYQTLTVMVQKCGYTVQEWCWYNGKPYTAEGLIMVVR